MIILVAKSIILGIVEGITEFLPISSTGHLILVNQFISFDKQFTVLFDIIIQLGAILAVLILFIKKLWPFTSDPAKNRETWDIWFKIIIAVLPALALGALFGSLVEEKLFNPWVVAAALLVGGIIIILVETRSENSNQGNSEKISSISNLSFKKAFGIGLIQCLSLIPGTSRSASTIIGGILLGASRTLATEFSFFLAIPTMFAASAYSLLKYHGPLASNQILILIIGFITSFFVALLAVRFLLRFIRTRSFKLFGYYRIILGLLILAYFLIY